MLSRIWNRLKIWRRLNLGPLTLIYKFQRPVRVTRNSKARRRKHARNVVATTNAPDPLVTHVKRNELAVIVGVGPGFGYALARQLASDGFQVLMVSRNSARLDPLVDEIRAKGGVAFAYGCDATLETSVLKLFELIKTHHGTPDLVVYSLQSFGPGQAIDIELPAFEDGWKHNCLGSFLVARSAARAMLPNAAGTIILVGSTSSVLGRAGHLNLVIGKFGQRGLAQVLARELWPKGIHVAHVIIDADIADGHSDNDGEPQADPNDIASTIVNIHRQPKSAWTSEVDIRPWDEKFWEHC